MPLVVDLKKGEKFIIGDTVIVNDSHNRRFTDGARLYIAGDAPVLRERDIIWEKDADSPAKRVYFLVQSMYLVRDAKPHLESYLNLAADIQKAAPGTASCFAKISELIQAGSYYKALKEVKSLLQQEQESPGNTSSAQNPSE